MDLFYWENHNICNENDDEDELFPTGNAPIL